MAKGNQRRGDVSCDVRKGFEGQDGRREEGPEKKALEAEGGRGPEKEALEAEGGGRRRRSFEDGGSMGDMNP